MRLIIFENLGIQADMGCFLQVSPANGLARTTRRGAADRPTPEYPAKNAAVATFGRTGEKEQCHQKQTPRP